MNIYELPPRFYEDHRSRDLPEEGTSTVVRETKSKVFVEMDTAAYEDLLSDADYYSHAEWFERELFGLCASARATHRALVKQGRPAQNSEGATLDEMRQAELDGIHLGSV